MNEPPLSLDHAAIAQALLTSPDGGETLDFSHHNLHQVGENGLAELLSLGERDPETAVSRLAMSYNRLVDLPLAFSHLSKLRYLNLRSNLLSNFPTALSSIPSLEILDLSRNNIDAFPEEPGALINLHILSVSRNRLSILPPYLLNFKRLKVLKVDHNPIVWPPAHVLEMKEEAFTAEDWLASLKKWLREDLDDHIYLNGSTAPYPVTGQSNQTTRHVQDWRSKVSSHSRISSTASIPSSTESSPERTNFGNAFVSHSVSNYSANISSDDDVDTTNGSHLRNASYSVGDHFTPRTSILASKKSLPDLRSAQRRRGHSIDAGVQRAGNGEKSYLGTADGVSHIQSSSLSEFALAPMATDRDAYFRRFSAHGSTNFAGDMPLGLVSSIDAIRNIYFAIHQVYEQIERFISRTNEGHVTGTLRKVLEPARVYTVQFTSALESWDSNTHLPREPIPAHLCKALFESCMNNVAVCGKVIAATRLQLKAITALEDIRFARNWVLILSGAVAEIAHSWKVIGTHSTELKPLFLDHTLRERDAGESDLVSTPSRLPLRNHEGRSRNTRRHAGSFSTRDVEIGRSMFSPQLIHASAKQGPEITSHSPSPGGSGRQPAPTPLAEAAVFSRGQHAFPMTASVQTALLPETPAQSSQLVDGELADTIAITVREANALWGMISDFADRGSNAKTAIPSLGETISTTIQLSDAIAKLRSGAIPGTNDIVFDHALRFIKAVALVSTELKRYGQSHALPSTLRARVANIAQSTTEIAVLLHVSSYSPSRYATPTPLSALARDE